MSLFIGFAIPQYAVTFRRLHDRNRSGWIVGVIWILNGISFAVNRIKLLLDGSIFNLPFIIVGGLVVVATLAVAIYALVQVCSVGDPTSNQYGEPPVFVPVSSRVEHVPLAPSAGKPADGHCSADPSDRIAQIERLDKLRQEGVLTDAEFAAEKAELLNRRPS